MKLHASAAPFAVCLLTKIVTTVTLLVAGAAQAAPIISPFAADLDASAYLMDRSAGGSSAQSAFNGGYWNAGAHGTHWIQADMGADFTLTQVQFALDVLPATGTEQWVYLSDVSVVEPGAALNLVAHRVGFTTQYERFALDFAPATGRFLLVVSHGGASWTAIGDSSPRLNWVDTGAGAGPVGGSGGNGVPEPGSMALAGAALGVLALLARRRRAGAGAAA